MWFIAKATTEFPSSGKRKHLPASPRSLIVLQWRNRSTMRYALLLIFLAAALGVVSARKASSEATAAAESLTAKTTAQLFAGNCASCHGKDGRAKTIKGKLKHARDLTDPEWQDRVSDERIFNAITNGKGKMPAYGKKLSEQEIEALVGHLRGLRR